MAEKIIQMQELTADNEVQADIYPTTVADAVKVGDSTLPKVLSEKTTYTNSTPIVTPMGDITTSETFENVPISDMLTKILYGYVAPTISLTATEIAGYKEIGTSITPTFNVTATKKSNNIEKLALLLGADEVKSETDGSVSFSYTPTTPITSTSEFKATVLDGKTTVASNTIAYTFVYPAFVGTTKSENPTGDTVTNMTKKITAKADIDNTFTLNEDRMVMACPPGWVLSKITDPNGLDITATFKVSTVPVTIAGESVSYTVYTSNPMTQTNFKVTFA